MYLKKIKIKVCMEKLRNLGNVVIYETFMYSTI